VNDVKRVQELFASGMSPKSTRLVEIDDDGKVVQERETLMYALESTQVEMFEVLASHGVSVTHRMSNGTSFTHLCSLMVVGSYKIALAALGYGADPRWPGWNVYPSNNIYGEPFAPSTMLYFAIQNSIQPLFDLLMTDYREAQDLEENWDQITPVPDQEWKSDGTKTLLGMAFSSLLDDAGAHIAKRLLEEGAKVYHTLLSDVIKGPSEQRYCKNMDAVPGKEQGRAILLEWVEAHPGCVHEWPGLPENADPKEDFRWTLATKEDRELFNKLWP